MPLVQITLARGRTPEQLAALGEKVTAAVSEAVGAPAGNVRVAIVMLRLGLDRAAAEARMRDAQELWRALGEE